MVEIIKSKSMLKDKKTLSVLAESVFNPTEVRLHARAEKYMQNPHITVFLATSEQEVLGIIVLDLTDASNIIILDIAVKRGYQKSGIGSSLIQHCRTKFKPSKIIAETDDDAVGFYQKLGFEIHHVGDVYRSGIDRYQCIMY